MGDDAVLWGLALPMLGDIAVLRADELRGCFEKNSNFADPVLRPTNRASQNVSIVAMPGDGSRLKLADVEVLGAVYVRDFQQLFLEERFSGPVCNCFISCSNSSSATPSSLRLPRCR